MPENHIAAALRAAAQTNCYGGMDGDNCDQCTSAALCRCPGNYMNATAAAVAAFLRALPANTGLMLPISPAHMRGVSTQALYALAAAVEQEARNDR